jgi:hypothetical protein
MVGAIAIVGCGRSLGITGPEETVVDGGIGTEGIVSSRAATAIFRIALET